MNSILPFRLLCAISCSIPRVCLVSQCEKYRLSPMFCSAQEKRRKKIKIFQTILDEVYIMFKRFVLLPLLACCLMFGACLPDSQSKNEIAVVDLGKLIRDSEPGKQAQVAVAHDLDEIIQKADKAGAERQKQHQQPGLHLLRQDQFGRQAQQPRVHEPDRHKHAQDKAEAAHGGRALLFVVPGGSILADGLAKVQAVQRRDQEKAGGGGYAEPGHSRRNQHPGYSHPHAVIPPSFRYWSRRPPLPGLPERAEPRTAL